ncbi:MAG: hypothetical protein KJO07_06000, partial [Deltaproteobacteria bacterium]|nr:hypothetical protein [Deltaproteobacteria bacterium]
LAFMRSGYTGSSQYVPMVWSGDPAASFEESDGLPSMIPAALNLGISGAPNSGGDIGGFHCTADGGEAADGELFTRWIQQGSMMPNMQDQDACVGGGVKANIFTSDDAQQAWKTYARLHTRLFPYFYTLAHRANQTGAPLMRQFFLEHPDRPDLAGVDDAYYLGSALVVAPVVRRGETSKTVELPAGSYFDWRDQAVVAGGQSVTIDAPLDKLPLLLRENHLIPLLDSTIDTLAKETNPEVVGVDDVTDVYDVVGYLTGGAAEFTLWDGESFTANLSGAASSPELPVAASEGELTNCDGCYLLETLPSGARRLRVSTTAASVNAGGLVLSSSSSRRVRWDLYLPAP